MMDYKDDQIVNCCKKMAKNDFLCFKTLGPSRLGRSPLLTFSFGMDVKLWNDQKWQALWNNHDLWQPISIHATVRHTCATFWAHCESRPHWMATLGWAFNGLEVCFAGNNLPKGLTSLGMTWLNPFVQTTVSSWTWKTVTACLQQQHGSLFGCHLTMQFHFTWAVFFLQSA